MQTPQVIFFDAAATLFHIKGSVAEIYQHYAVRHGFKQTPESLAAIKQAFSRAFKDAPPAIFASTEPAALKQSERLWWFDIVHNVFYRVGMFEGFDEFCEEVFQIFEDPKTWTLYPETEAVLSHLKAQGMELKPGILHLPPIQPRDHGNCQSGPPGLLLFAARYPV